MAGPGGKRLPLGNHPFKQSTRDKQMQCCLNNVRHTCEELIPPLCQKYLSRCGVLLRSSCGLCADNVHVSLLQKFNNLFFFYRVNIGVWLEKVIFFLQLEKTCSN